MRTLTLTALLAVAACGSPTDVDVPDVYAFQGRTGTDSVSYSGQVFRQLLIDDLKLHLGGVTGRVDGGWFPAPGDVRAELDFYYAFDGDSSGELPFGYTSDPPPLQRTYADIASKSLAEKIAGNDPNGQHVDWSTGLAGWSDPEITSPEALVLSWFDQIDALAVARANGNGALDPSGEPVTKVYLTSDGLDLLQLTEKFLRGAVGLSQGADDYLDDDLDGKGLLSDHSALVEGEAYTELEHSWDEGFGYFGASRSYGSHPAAELAASAAIDADGDGRIDLLSEVSWGHSGNAAKRDVDSAIDAPTDFAADAWRGFAGGRALIDNAEGPLSDDQLDELRAFRDQAVGAWEQAIAASVVHYANEVLADMNSADATFADRAKHWSELKGFALSLQFNPRSPLTDARFAELHTLIGDRPVLPTAPDAEREAYADDLRAARALLGVEYGFDAHNLGDDHGEAGW